MKQRIFIVFKFLIGFILIAPSVPITLFTYILWDFNALKYCVDLMCDE